MILWDIRYDTALWAVVVFVELLLILRAKAWGPILEGLQKREETIRALLGGSQEDTRRDGAIASEFKKELQPGH